MMFKALLQILKREILILTSRPMFMVVMILIPVGTSLFLMDLLKKGSAFNAPAAVVDLDQSKTSQSLSRTLEAMHSVHIKYHFSSFSQAEDAVKRGEIFGFFVIPHDFEREAIAMRQPKLSYYCNYAYFVPSSLMFKGMKTTSVLASGAMVTNMLSAKGADSRQISAVLQPIVSQAHQIGNPQMHYGVYLCNSFIPGVIALMVMIMTCYMLTMEIKHHTSTELMQTAHGSILAAVVGKLLPSTVLFSLVGWAIQMVMYYQLEYPLHCSIFTMMAAMLLLVLASQAIGLFVSCIIPNPRLSISVCSLLGMLSFSFCGISFPIENMYPVFQVLGWMMPLRHFFLIYVDQALNGVDIYYSRVYFAVMLLYTLLPIAFLPLLKKNYQNPVYVP